MGWAMTFLRNAWYVCAWSNEVGAEALLARTILGEPVICFRDSDGRPVVLEDRCCHRQMPLSKGWLEQGTIRCGYHGLRFDRAGKCVEIPGQTSIPPRAKVRAYPTVERYRWIWLWPGDPALADPGLIPEFFEPNDSPAWSVSCGTSYVRCNYELISDNLLDLTHETYVHRTSLGNQHVVEHPIKLTSGLDWVTVTRLIPNHDPAPFWKKAIKGAKNLTDDVMCDRWQVIHYRPPANLVLEVGVAPTGTGALQGDRSKGVEGRNLNAITPETEESSFLFWTLARNFSRDPALDAVFAESTKKILEEDRVTCEAVHQVMRRSAGRPVVDVNADGGTVAARRMLAQLIAKESAAVNRAAE
jgi:phenylpropionate dioxygenase-like ring-hydroxylating dioxygenase large terminal subunit